MCDLFSSETSRNVVFSLEACGPEDLFKRVMFLI